MLCEKFTTKKLTCRDLHFAVSRPEHVSGKWSGWAGVTEGGESGERKFPPFPLRSRRSLQLSTFSETSNYIETLVHHYWKFTAAPRYHQSAALCSLGARSLSVWRMHLCRTRIADALWAFPALRRRTARSALPKMDCSAPDGSDLCSPKIAVVSIISGMDARLLPATLRHRSIVIHAYGYCKQSKIIVSTLKARVHRATFLPSDFCLTASS